MDRAMIFGHSLKWDTLSIQKAISDHLENLKWNVETSFGFADSGETAFIITARKEKNIILIYLENEQKQVMIKAGLDAKYLPEGKKLPKYSKVFSSEKIQDAGSRPTHNQESFFSWAALNLSR